MAAVVVAAGRGERLGDGRPKALVELAGRPLLDHALERVLAAGIDEVVVVGPAGQLAEVRDVCRPRGVDAVVEGGDTRTASVRAGVRALGPDVAVVAVHDAARPLTPPGVIARAIEAVDGDVVAAAPAVPVRDTLKHADDRRVVIDTVDRSGLWAVHTPQVVRADVLRIALACAPDEAVTDDLGLVEHALAAGAVSGRVVLVAGDVRDLKITYPADLVLAAALLASAP